MFIKPTHMVRSLFFGSWACDHIIQEQYWRFDQRIGRDWCGVCSAVTSLRLPGAWRNLGGNLICSLFVGHIWTAPGQLDFPAPGPPKLQLSEVVLCRRAKPMWNWRPWRWSCRWRPGPPGRGRVGSGVKDVDGRCRGWTNFHQFLDIDYIDLGLISDKW
jgi:hypothetical protein